MPNSFFLIMRTSIFSPGINRYSKSQRDYDYNDDDDECPGRLKNQLGLINNNTNLMVYYCLPTYLPTLQIN